MRKIIGAIVLIAFLLCPSAAGWGRVAAPQETSPTVSDLEAKADAYRLRKEYDKAIPLYLKALKSDKKNAVLYNKLGIAELQTGDRDAARGSFNKAIKRNRKYAEPVNNLGVIAYMNKDYRKAVRYYRKALSLNDANASFHNNLGTALFAQHLLDEAMAEFVRAVELDPEVFLRSQRGGMSAQISSPEDRAAYSYLLAKIYARRGEMDRCLDCLKTAKEEGYARLQNVYKDPEFEALRQDPRLAIVVPKPMPQ